MPSQIKMIINQVYEDMFSLLSFFPQDYLDGLKLARVYDAYVKEEKNALAINCILFFLLILKKEQKKVDLNVLRDIMLLQTLFFYAYGLYDAVHDQKKTPALPCANILFKEALILAGKHGFDLRTAINTLEQYNQNPLILTPGRLQTARVVYFDNHWSDLKKGFAIAPVIIQEFINRFLPGCKYNWPLFFENFLIYSQILDDVHDFSLDYKNNELKSFGIFTLVKKFKQKSCINLNNPLVSFRYELSVLRNIDSLYKEFMDRFWEYIGQDPDREFFLQTLEELKSFNSWRGELLFLYSCKMN